MSKTILITGTRKGIGKALVKHYLRAGHYVFGCSRGESSISHERYGHYTLDVSDEKAVVTMVRSIAKERGIDVLINNAGIASMAHVLLSSTVVAQDIMSTNFIGPFMLIREVGKVMRKNEYGRIVNLTTIAKPLNMEGEALYASSKAALETLTRIAAKELADLRITVNAIGPTPIKTDLLKGVSDEKMAALLGQQAIKRLGEFDDVANVVDFFISEKSAFVTGQTIYLGGVANG